MSSSNSGLPDGTEDFVGVKAEELEKLRSLFLNFFYKNNCELVVPSLIEFSEIIGGNFNESLRDYAYSFSDENLKNISIRPDISQQIARIDLQQGSKDKKKYCYFGETLRKTKDSLTKSKIAFKTGVEIFGKISITDEIDLIKLMLLSLKKAGKYKMTISLGRTEPLSEILNGLNLSLDENRKLKKIIASKSKTDLEEFFNSKGLRTKSLMEIKNLMEVNGKIECLKYLKKHKNKVFQASARKIEKIIKNLPPSIDYHLDFSDFPGFDYHSGLVFSVHVLGFGFSIAKGGQYKSMQNHIVREAIGFDVNVSSLTKLNK
ncbi:ATP phosphoribosyltransferase regulatory subunit [Gammaproteobacteria bacterium]|nr:ATP phosphoribosyltransferase regulatory subunit [Gammaproteobacteria bacterium]